jgi:flagellin-specific chaperone FliS
VAKKIKMGNKEKLLVYTLYLDSEAMRWAHNLIKAMYDIQGRHMTEIELYKTKAALEAMEAAIKALEEGIKDEWELPS